MTITSKVRRGQLYLGEDKTLVFNLDLEEGDDPSLWTVEFVIRERSRSCRDPRDDPGDGTLLLTISGGSITVLADPSRIEVEVAGGDVIDAGIQADDYFAALNRIDVGNTRPLAILSPLHFSSWPQGD